MKTSTVFLTAGDYFGERSLLMHEKRAGTVTVTKPNTVLYKLSSDAFKELFSDPEVIPQITLPRRASITQQSMWKRAVETSRVSSAPVTKTKAQKSFLMTTLGTDKVFNLVYETEDLQVMVKFMYKRQLNEGDRLSTSPGLFVVESGKVKDAESNRLYEAGDVIMLVSALLQFGVPDEGPKADSPEKSDPKNFQEKEKALRASSIRRRHCQKKQRAMSTGGVTIRAFADTDLWMITEGELRFAMRATKEDHLEKVEAFIRKLPIFHPLNNYEIALLAQALEGEMFSKDDFIATEGSEANNFWIIVEGTATVFVTVDGIREDRRIITSQDCFGEQPLMKKETLDIPKKHTESVQVMTSYLRAMKINYHEFRDLCGSLEGHLMKIEKMHTSMYLPREDDQFRTTEFKSLKVTGLLGTGTFGKVYLVENSQGQQLALKEISTKAWAKNKTATGGILHEKKIGLMLKNNFVVRVYKTFKDDISLWFLIDVCHGGTLLNLVTSQDCLQERDCCFYIGSLVLAFEHIHSQKIVHRDLKLENVFLDSKGYVKLGDFGLAKIVHTRTYSFAGTTVYMAPEMLRHKPYGHGVDWWALGVLTFELLSGGITPFETNSRESTIHNIKTGRMTDVAKMYHESFSEATASWISGLLNMLQFRRLGATNDGVTAVKEHAFFESFSWAQLEKMQVSFFYLLNHFI